MTAMTVEDQDLNVSVLAALLPNTDPDLFAPALPTETDLERAARRQAAADIIIDALMEASATDDPGGVESGVEHVAGLVRIRTDAPAQAPRWLAQIRGAAA